MGKRSAFLAGGTLSGARPLLFVKWGAAQVEDQGSVFGKEAKCEFEFDTDHRYSHHNPGRDYPVHLAARFLSLCPDQGRHALLAWLVDGCDRVRRLYWTGRRYFSCRGLQYFLFQVSWANRRVLFYLLEYASWIGALQAGTEELARVRHGAADGLAAADSGDPYAPQRHQSNFAERFPRHGMFHHLLALCVYLLHEGDPL